MSGKTECNNKGPCKKKVGELEEATGNRGRSWNDVLSRRRKGPLKAPWGEGSISLTSVASTHRTGPGTQQVLGTQLSDTSEFHPAAG